MPGAGDGAEGAAVPRLPSRRSASDGSQSARVGQSRVRWLALLPAPQGRSATSQRVGNVNLTGSNARIRGAIITGDLVVAGSNAALSFTRVMGRASISGSSATLLEGSLCGGASVSGGAALFLGNVGLEPLGSCP